MVNCVFDTERVTAYVTYGCRTVGGTCVVWSRRVTILMLFSGLCGRLRDAECLSAQRSALTLSS